MVSCQYSGKTIKVICLRAFLLKWTEEKGKQARCFRDLEMYTGGGGARRALRARLRGGRPAEFRLRRNVRPRAPAPRLLS